MPKPRMDKGTVALLTFLASVLRIVAAALERVAMAQDET